MIYFVEVHANVPAVGKPFTGHAKSFHNLCAAHKWMEHYKNCGGYRYTFKIYTATEVAWAIETKETLVIKD
jgi:hypothetical protein